MFTLKVSGMGATYNQVSHIYTFLTLGVMYTQCVRKLCTHHHAQEKRDKSHYPAVNSYLTYLDRNPHKSLNSAPSDIMLKSVTFFRIVSPSCTNKHAIN